MLTPRTTQHRDTAQRSRGPEERRGLSQVNPRGANGRMGPRRQDAAGIRHGNTQKPSEDLAG